MNDNYSSFLKQKAKQILKIILSADNSASSTPSIPCPWGIFQTFLGHGTLRK